VYSVVCAALSIVKWLADPIACQAPRACPDDRLLTNCITTLHVNSAVMMLTRVSCRHYTAAGRLAVPVSSRAVSAPTNIAPALLARACFQQAKPLPNRRQQVALRASGGEGDKEPEEDLPPWVRREREKKAAESTGELPFGLYLLFSSFVAIAAIGSIFEFFNKNAIAGVIEPDNPLWAPILIIFGLTGLPTAGYLFVKGVTAANAAADAMDKVDGF